MAIFNYEGHDIYYETHGEGETLLVLNGIFMSCASWGAFVPAFSKHNRLLLVDMLDQGKSARVDFEYTQDLQVKVVVALLDYLQLGCVNVCGISYGGEIAMKLAGLHPQRVNKLVLSNTAAYTSPWLRDIGHSWEFAYKSGNGHQFFKTCIPTVYSPQFYEENYEWASAREEMFVQAFGPDVYAAFGRLTRSAETHDARGVLANITAQCLIISAELDYITPPHQQRELAAAIKNSHEVMILSSGHGVMYEKPNEFLATVLGFINNDTSVKIV